MDEEIKIYYLEYKTFFDTFPFMIDGFGNFAHLPFEGGMLEQPALTMSIYCSIQQNFKSMLELPKIKK